MLRFKSRDFILWSLILLPYLFLIFAWFWYHDILNNVKNSTFIVISKQEMMLYHYNYSGELLQKSGIACGKKFGNKNKIGDNKTPEGIFRIEGVENASSWSHDFKDDSLGEIKGAYGPYFIRLIVPGQKGIGIHGTHAPNSIGTRVSEGCIRMYNDELLKLVKNISTASIVIVTPSQSDNDSAYIEKIIKETINKQIIIKQKKKK